MKVSLCTGYLAHNSLQVCKMTCRSNCVDSGKYLHTYDWQLKNAAINRICLCFYSVYHSCPLLILTDNFLGDNYSFTTPGEFNSMVPFLYHLSPLFLFYHQVGKPEWALSLQPVPAPLRLAGWLAGWFLFMPGFSWHPSQSGQPMPACRLLVLLNIVTLWWIAQCVVLATLE